jgi:exodeoxyribonuclease VII small subunit
MELKPKSDDFEMLLKRLEEIVEKMDGGGLGLEESMKLYEEGMKNAERLAAMLADARDRVMKLVGEKDGAAVLAPFDEGETR